jgi:hypothetical protein
VRLVALLVVQIALFVAFVHLDHPVEADLVVVVAVALVAFVLVDSPFYLCYILIYKKKFTYLNY